MRTKSKPSISAAEQSALCSRAQAGDIGARNSLIESVTGLIAHKANALVKSCHNSAIDVDDCTQEGVFAVIDAIRCFDPSRGYVFSTYAGDCIYRRIAKFIAAETAAVAMQDLDSAGVGLDELTSLPALIRERIAEIKTTVNAMPKLRAAVASAKLGIGCKSKSWTQIAMSLGCTEAEARMEFEKAGDELAPRRSKTVGPSTN